MAATSTRPIVPGVLRGLVLGMLLGGFVLWIWRGDGLERLMASETRKWQRVIHERRITAGDLN